MSMLGEQLDHLDRLMSEVNKKRQELEAGKVSLLLANSASTVS